MLGSEVQYLKRNGICSLLHFLPLQSILIESSKNKWHTAKDCENIQRKIFRKTNQACHVAFIIRYFLLIWLVLLLCLHSLKSWFHPSSFFSNCLWGSDFFPHPISSLIMTCLQVFSRKKNFFYHNLYFSTSKNAVSLFTYNTCSSPTSIYPRAWAHEPELSKEFTVEIFLDLNWFDSAFADWFRIINSSLALGGIGNILGSEDLPKVPDPSAITHILFSSNSDCLQLTSHISGNWLLGFIFSHSKNPLLAPKRNVKEDSAVNDSPVLLHTLVAPVFLLTDPWVVSNFEL